MWEWIIENANLIYIVCGIVVFVSVISIVITTMITKSKIRGLKKQLIRAHTMLSRFCGVGYGNIKDGTREEVLAQMRPLITKKMKYESFSTPCGRFCQGSICVSIHNVGDALE